MHGFLGISQWLNVDKVDRGGQNVTKISGRHICMDPNFDLFFPSDGGLELEVHVRRWLPLPNPKTAASHRKPEITGATDKQAESSCGQTISQRREVRREHGVNDETAF